MASMAVLALHRVSCKSKSPASYAAQIWAVKSSRVARNELSRFFMCVMCVWFGLFRCIRCFDGQQTIVANTYVQAFYLIK
jgi:hypothetical protein